MSRFVIAMLFFVAIFVGFGLGALGVPAEYAIASGLVVTGGALVLGGRRKELKELVPVNLIVVGVTFVGLGGLLAVGGACGYGEDDADDDARRGRPTSEQVARRSAWSGR